MTDGVEIRSKDIKMVAVEEIYPNMTNRNLHSEEQIERLAEIIKYQGFRSPLIISNRSGFLVSGHGRLLAAKKLGLTELPCIFQDFDDDDQEYAAGISENAVASWSELDMASIHLDLPDVTLPNIDLLGIKNFSFEPEIEVAKKEKAKAEIACPACGERFAP